MLFTLAFDSLKVIRKRGKGSTLHELQEQELQLPEQQLHAQGDIVKVGSWFD